MKAFKELGRTKKLCVYILLIVLLITFLVKNSGYYLNPEAVYRAYEKGENLPAAEEIVCFPYGENKVMILTSTEHGIFSVTAYKNYGLWKGTGRYLEYADEQYPLDFFYEPVAGVIYGTTWIERAAQIYFEGRYSDIYEKDVTGVGSIDENRCFILEAAPYEHAKGAMSLIEKGSGSFYAELLDETGNVIWKFDETTHLR